MADEKTSDSTKTKTGRLQTPAGKGAHRSTPEGAGPARAEEKPTDPPPEPKAPGRIKEPAGKSGR